MARLRWRELPRLSGQLSLLNSDGSVAVAFKESISPKVSVCEDIVGNLYAVNPLRIEHRVRAYSPYSGEYDFSDGTPYMLAQDYWDTYQVTYEPEHLPLSIKTVTGSQLAYRTSPSKPLMDLPVYLVELRDLPEMIISVWKGFRALPNLVQLIKKAGEDIIMSPYGRRRNVYGYSRKVGQSAASANLSYQFGWAPLVSDLLKLLQFADAYKRRTAELEKLFGTGGLRRRVTIDDVHREEGPFTQYFNSAFFSSWGEVLLTTEAKRWGVVRWKSTLHPPGSKPSQVDVVRSLLGLDVNPANIWALLPWSWLVDWFTGVGDYLDAYRNTIPALATEMSMMTHTVTTARRTSVNTSGWISGGSGYFRRDTKERVPLTISVEIPGWFPFLGANQVGILGSLSVTRRNAWK